jgi:hypothetical protein
VTVAAKVSKLCGEFLLSRVGVSEMAECSDDFLDALLFITQEVAVLLELGLRPRAVLPIGRIEGTLQMVTGMIEIDDLQAVRERSTEVTPVVLRRRRA